MLADIALNQTLLRIDVPWIDESYELVAVTPKKKK
jgi:hypothetical protein